VEVDLAMPVIGDLFSPRDILAGSIWGQPGKLHTQRGAPIHTPNTVLHKFRTDMPLNDRKLSFDELGHASVGAHRVPVERPIRVVLDDVRSRHNVGSIFRSADAFGVEGLVLCGFTPHPPHREIEKTALGATLSVPWTVAKDALHAVQELKAKGYQTIAVEQTRMAVPLQTMTPLPGKPLALVVGNELNGVSEAVVAACDVCVLIPQSGSKHSLNVSVCAGVVLWWFTRTVDPR